MTRLQQFKLLSATVGRLPAPLVFALSGPLGRLLALVAPNRQRVRLHCLRAAGLANFADPELLVLMSSTYRTALENYYDLLRLPHRTRLDLERQVSLTGNEHIRAIAATGRGVIVFLGHLGGFETALHEAPVGDVPCGVLVEPLEPPEFHNYVAGLRATSGLEVIPTTAPGLRRALAILKGGGVLGIAIDRDLGGGGVDVEVLGTTARMPPGAAQLAARTGAALLPGTSVREPGGRVIGIIEPEMVVDRTGPRTAVEARLFQACLGALEGLIRSNPGQWVVFEPLWADEYPVPSVALPQERSGSPHAR